MKHIIIVSIFIIIIGLVLAQYDHTLILLKYSYRNVLIEPL